MRAIHFLVFGRVQGVWFRKFTLETATRLGIVGWVRNNSDGSVEGEAVGTEDALRAFREALREGSPQSRVEDVSTEPLPIIDFRSFEIRR